MRRELKLRSTHCSRIRPLNVSLPYSAASDATEHRTRSYPAKVQVVCCHHGSVPGSHVRGLGIPRREGAKVADALPTRAGLENDLKPFSIPLNDHAALD